MKELLECKECLQTAKNILLTELHKLSKFRSQNPANFSFTILKYVFLNDDDHKTLQNLSDLINLCEAEEQHTDISNTILQIHNYNSKNDPNFDEVSSLQASLYKHLEILFAIISHIGNRKPTCKQNLINAFMHLTNGLLKLRSITINKAQDMLIPNQLAKLCQWLLLFGIDAKKEIDGVKASLSTIIRKAYFAGTKESVQLSLTIDKITQAFIDKSHFSSLVAELSSGYVEQIFKNLCDIATYHSITLTDYLDSNAYKIIAINSFSRAQAIANQLLKKVQPEHWAEIFIHYCQIDINVSAEETLKRLHFVKTTAALLDSNSAIIVFKIFCDPAKTSHLNKKRLESLLQILEQQINKKENHDALEKRFISENLTTVPTLSRSH